ncbi:MAG: YggT family protein [Blastocatellia bacterium]|nr:YggT family protein [Blastocatellia bacterium]
MLEAVSIAKGLVEIFLFAALGQGALRLLAGGASRSNAIYALFAAVTRPVFAPFRKLLPARMADGILPALLACLSLLALWLALVLVKIRLVLGSA